jgi:hypothetical protein
LFAHEWLFDFLEKIGDEVRANPSTEGWRFRVGHCARFINDLGTAAAGCPNCQPTVVVDMEVFLTHLTSAIDTAIDKVS